MAHVHKTFSNIQCIQCTCRCTCVCTYRRRSSGHLRECNQSHSSSVVCRHELYTSGDSSYLHMDQKLYRERGREERGEEREREGEEEQRERKDTSNTLHTHTHTHTHTHHTHTRTHTVTSSSYSSYRHYRGP